MYTHILIHTNSESNAESVFALCSGESRLVARNGRILTATLPSHILQNIKARRVAPRVIRLDKVGSRDIDYAMIRQYLAVAWGLISFMRGVDEREGFTSS